MIRHVKQLAPILVGLAVFGFASWADVVELTDGRKIEGVILVDSPREVTMKLDTGATVNFPRSRVRSVSRADWGYYVQKGDKAASGTEALEYYQMAKKLNPNAPGLDEKISTARRRAETEAKRLLSDKERSARRAEELKVIGRYQQLMDAVRRDEARDLLEKEITAKPWLCRPRILLADFYVRERTPDNRVRYVATLAGLVRNDPAAYFDTHVPQIVEAAERALLDSTAAGEMPVELKDRLIAEAAPFVGQTGQVLALGDFENLEKTATTSASITLMKIEFLRSVCMKRSDDTVGIEREAPLFSAYGSSYSPADKQSVLGPQLDQWGKQAQELIDRGETKKATTVADLILALDPESGSGKAIVVKARVQEARAYRERKQWERARRSIEMAEKVAQKDAQVEAEKSRLFVALAQFHTAARNWEEAANAIASAVAIRPSDPEAANLVRSEQDRLFAALKVMAEMHSQQKHPELAIAVTEIAMKVKTDVVTSLAVKTSLASYRKQLRDSVRQQIKSAGERQAFEEITAAKTLGQTYNAWDSQLDAEVGRLAREAKQKAEEAASRGDAIGAFMLAGRVQRLPVDFHDPKVDEILRKSREATVTAGQLNVLNFFGAAWVGPDIQWVLSETSSNFNGRGFRADASNLAAGAVRAEHGGGDRYTIRITRSDAEDAAVVDVIGPDTLLLLSYSSKPYDTSRPTANINYNVEIKRTLLALPGAAPGTATPPAAPSSPES